MSCVTKVVFSTFLLACILVSSSAATECEIRKAACDATCQSSKAISDFKCDEQNGAISSSCACAAPGSSSSSSSASSTSSPPSSPPSPLQAPEPQPAATPSPPSTSCEQKQQACVASCPEGTSAQFDCKQDQSTKSASASADSCVCSPIDSSTNPPIAPNPTQGTVIAPVTGTPNTSPNVGNTSPNTSPNVGNTGLPGRTAGAERSTNTTVVNAGYTNKPWKVLTGSILGAALFLAL